MALKIFKEPLIGKYDGVTAVTQLPPGSLSGGLNVRKVSRNGGWKPRKGCELNNTTALESGSQVDSIHQFENYSESEVHFIAQCNGKLYEATNTPPDDGTTFGSDLGDIASISVSSSNPGYSCNVNDNMVYCDGSGPPVVWGGDKQKPIAILREVTSGSETFNNNTLVLTDGDPTTTLVLSLSSTYDYIIVSRERLTGITVTVDTANTNNCAFTVRAYRTSGFTAVSGYSDGTSVASKTLAQSGTISWTYSSSDIQVIYGGFMGYVYEFNKTSTTSAGTAISKVSVTQPLATMSHKWDGIWQYVTGCIVYEFTDDYYYDALGLITNESTSQYIDMVDFTSNHEIYVKAPEQIAAIGFSLPPGQFNASSFSFTLYYWTGDAWSALATVFDTTMYGIASMAKTGYMVFRVGALFDSIIPRTLEGDPIPGYWYKLDASGTPSDDTRIYSMVYAPFPSPLKTYSGCVEFKNRTFLWGDGAWPNRLRYSTSSYFDCFVGCDSGYTEAFGDGDKILCAIQFYNELVVFKKHSTYILGGFDSGSFGITCIAKTIGIASPKTARIAEVGTPNMRSDEPLSVLLWQDTDGVYMLDGRKPRKISGPVDHYFNQEYSTCIAAASINSLSAFIDSRYNEYHLLLPSSELVYNYLTDEWYPPWEREIDLVCGLELKGTDNRYYAYGGTATGFVMKLDSDTTDKNAADADVLISHSVKTRAIGSEQELSPVYKFNIRRIWAELKAQAAGSITTKVFKNTATSGETLTSPAAMSMIKAGQTVTFPQVNCSFNDCNCFQVEFSLAVADQEMTIYGLLYELEHIGLMGL